MSTLPPLPDPQRDWLPIVVRFVLGALFGAPFGLVIAMDHSMSDAIHIIGLVGGAALGGVLAAWLRGGFWDAVARSHWTGWFRIVLVVLGAGAAAFARP